MKNVNVGVMGHVDAGKTSLCKFISEKPSTACFDKHPQSQQRGITIDLGFSSLTLPTSDLQVTLVDCPGHASLFRTVIAASSIIDAVLLVVDAKEGFQVQTAECLLLAAMVTTKLIVVISKIDRCVDDGDDLEKIEGRVRKHLRNTKFGDNVLFVRNSVHIKECRLFLLQALETLFSNSAIERPINIIDHSSQSVIIATDHCFQVKHVGTIVTGTILKGTVSVGDDLQCPSIGNRILKVKSLQSFHHSIKSAQKGDRVGINFGNGIGKEEFGHERSILCAPSAKDNVLLRVNQVIIENLQPVVHYRGSKKSGMKVHLSVLNQFVTVQITFIILHEEDNKGEYELLEEYQDNCSILATIIDESMLLFLVEGSLAVLTRMDLDCSLKQCRLVMSGTLRLPPYRSSQIRLFHWKQRRAKIDKIIDDYRAIGKDICHVDGLQRFIGHTCLIVKDDIVIAEGIIESTFGKSGKFNIQLKTPIKDRSLPSCQIIINYKKYI